MAQFIKIFRSHDDEESDTYVNLNHVIKVEWRRRIIVFTYVVNNVLERGYLNMGRDEAKKFMENL